MSPKDISLEVIPWPPGFIRFNTAEFNFDLTNNIHYGFNYGYYEIYNSRYDDDIVRINSYKFYPDDSYDLFLISLDTDSLYQGLHVKSPDTLSQRFLIYFFTQMIVVGINLLAERCYLQNYQRLYCRNIFSRMFLRYRFRRRDSH